MAQKSVFKTLLENTPVTALPTPMGQVVTVNSNETPYDGFKKLVNNHILSAPVYDLSTKKYTGFLEVRDLVSFVVFIDDDQRSDVPNNLHDLILHGVKLFKQPSDGVTVTYLSRRNPFRSVTTKDSLYSVVEILGTSVHRVPVINERGEVVNIISQSSIIGFLNKHLNAELKDSVNQTVGELRLGSRPVVTVSKNSPAIETFRLMDNKKISGVAVIDEDGKLVGNTSGSDLKLFIKTLSLDTLKKPTMQFLNLIRQESLTETSPTIACSSKDTLGTVIAKLAVTKIHRIFVADDISGYRPSAVISITDIMRHIIKLDK